MFFSPICVNFHIISYYDFQIILDTYYSHIHRSTYFPDRRSFTADSSSLQTSSVQILELS